MVRIKYGSGGYHMTDSEVHDLLISVKAIKAALSQNAHFPADIDLAKREAEHILKTFGIE